MLKKLILIAAATLALAGCAGMSGGASPGDEQAVAAAAEKLRVAMIDPTPAALNPLLADDLSYGHSGGKVDTKTSFINDLMDVSRITRGGIELQKSSIDLRDVIRVSIETLFPILSQRRAPVLTQISEDPLLIDGDSDRLQQVIVNLLSNSARYSSDDKPIHLSAGVEGDSIVVRVKDSGSGIPKEMLEQIFELFVQSHQGLERSKGGMGIGLTLVRRILELHGGFVEAFSDGPETGSEFVVRLPRQAVAPAANDNKSDGAVSTQLRRILVVEDQDDAREVMCYLLAMKGHDVKGAADGQTALDLITTDRPDIVFVDIGLPVLNGYEVAKKVRSNPALDHVVLVALTGYGQKDDVQVARTSGFDEHVAKPADPDAIDVILDKWKHGQAARLRRQQFNGEGAAQWMAS